MFLVCVTKQLFLLVNKKNDTKKHLNQTLTILHLILHEKFYTEMCIFSFLFVLKKKYCVLADSDS